MVGFGKNKLKTVNLTKEEQFYILQFCEDLTPVLKNKIRFMTDETLYLMEGESDVLLGCIACALESDSINNPKVSAILDEVIKRIPLSNEITHFLERCEDQDPNDPQGWKKAQDKIDEEKKTAPDPFRGNLTPQQITRFTDYRWGDPEFPLQFNHDLSVKEANQSLFFRNTRLFLNTLIDCKDIPTATVRGNLNRKFVKRMFDEMELDDEYRDFRTKYHKVLNEQDVRPLHIIRVICECAGLIKIQKNKILVVKKQYPMLSDENAGDLYYRLFDTYFNRFNLSYLDRLPELDGIVFRQQKWHRLVA